MELRDMIAKRKSVRKFTGVPAQEQVLQQIRGFMAEAKPLYPDIQVRGMIVDQTQARVFCPVKAPQLIAVYSEKKEGYLENAGFIFQQVELYLQSLGLGVCWLGLGKMREKPDEVVPGMEFVILLGFGYPEGEQLRSGPEQFQRKALSEIADRADERLEPARLAPSSTNSQPWRFVHEGQTVHAYCSLKGLARHVGLGAMNRIDMGIALAHLYVEHPDTFHFFRNADPEGQKGYQYIGSFTLDKS